MKTPEQRFYDAVVHNQLNGRTGDIGWILNEMSYEDALHICKRMASRIGYEVIKMKIIEEDFLDE